MATRRGLRLGRGGYGWGICGAWEERLDNGGPAHRRQWDSCMLDCCEAWIATRGCVSFCGIDEIFPFMAEALIGEGIVARTMRIQG
jgi:hypothetical protein